MKSRRMGWSGHVASTRDMRMYTTFQAANLKESNHLGDLCMDGTIKFKEILKK
jgi:hypothetical protein